MIAAEFPVQRPRDARLLVIAGDATITHAPRARLVSLLRTGDLVIANDAATFPASLHGIHMPSGAPVEVRLAGRRSLAPHDVRRFTAVLFGAGDYHTRTEHRPAPPEVARGDRLQLGPLSACVEEQLGHPRLIRLRFGGSLDAIWAGLARYGRPIQYAHVPNPLELWDVWTRIAAVPAAFEAPSASFAIDWASIQAMRGRGVEFATMTATAGISSTGDPKLDERLPLDEPYRISESTAAAILRARERGGRIVAVGTSVVRALEHAASDGGIKPGEGVANQRIGPATTLRVVDVILSGTHERGTSHYDLLRAFVDDETLAAADAQLEGLGYRTHEFGDSVFIENMFSSRASLIAA